MSYEPYDSDRGYNHAITKIYRARQRAAEMQRLGDEMRKLQAQMNHTFPKSTERWYNMRSHGTLQISGSISGRSKVELAEVASELGERVGTTDFWISTPKVRFRVRDLLRNHRYEEVISIFELILEGRYGEALSWLGIEHETYEVHGWGMSEPVRVDTQIISDEEQKRRAVEAWNSFRQAIDPRTEADILERFNKLVDEGHRVAQHRKVSDTLHQLLEDGRLSEADRLLDLAEAYKVEMAVDYVSKFMGLNRDEKVLLEIEIRAGVESPAQLDAEFQAEREKEEEVDHLNQVLTLKKKVEGFAQAEEEARDRARKAKIMCSAIVVGLSVGGILVNSVLISIMCTIFGLIFLTGALNPIKNNSLVITAVENRKDAQAQLDKATTEWLKAEGLS